MRRPQASLHSPEGEETQRPPRSDLISPGIISKHGGFCAPDGDSARVRERHGYNINCIDGELKSVNVTKLGSESGELLVLIYDSETLVDIKSMNVSQSGSYNIECDLSNYKNCKVTAFIWNRFVGVNHILSNEKSGAWEDK